MKYLVTGICGFIGSHLAQALVQNGNTVVGVDNYSDYYSVDLKELRKTTFLDSLGIPVVNGDLASEGFALKIVSETQPDVVVHLAAQPGVRIPMAMSQKYIKDNIDGYTNLLAAIVTARIPSFLYASSSSVYGNSTNYPYSESESGLSPISVYGATKLSNEILARAYVKGSQTRARGMRFFTVYGPWGRPDMAYFRLLANALVQTPFTLFGNGEVKRDFTYVGDIVKMISHLAQELVTHEGGFSDVVNIGGGNPYSMNDLINTLNTKLNLKIEIIAGTVNSNDTLYTCADIKKIESLIGTKPTTSLLEGLDHVLQWCNSDIIRNNLDRWAKSNI
jgi:UDP-glucuronate 4-epimerase